MTKEHKIKIFTFIILTGFIAAVFYHYVLGAYLGKPYPSNSFLFTPVDHFMDFINVYKIKSSVYFPFANLIINIFCLIDPINRSLTIFLLLSIVPIIWYFWQNLKGTSKIDSITNTIVFSFCTFPILFLIDRANFESFVFIFLCMFIYFYQKGEVNYSVIPLAFAISMKLFPAVFLLLLFSDRKYKQLVYTIILVLILTLFSSFILYGGITGYLSKLMSNSNFYQMKYVIWDDGMDFGHSLFGFFKYVIYANNLDIGIASIVKPYNIFIVILAGLISVYIILIEKELWKKAALLVFIMCLLPTVSADYKLTYLYIPIFLFINFNAGVKQPALVSKKNDLKNGTFPDYYYIILFGLLLIPKNYRLVANIYDGVYIDPVLMSLLAFLIIRSGISKGTFQKKEMTKKIKSKG